MNQRDLDELAAKTYADTEFCEYCAVFDSWPNRPAGYLVLTNQEPPHEDGLHFLCGMCVTQRAMLCGWYIAHHDLKPEPPELAALRGETP